MTTEQTQSNLPEVDTTSELNSSQILEQVKRSDPMFHIIRRGYPALIQKKNRRTGKIYEKMGTFNAVFEVYSSGCTGSQIRNAVTGEYTPYIVGSSDEDMFFRVINSTGEMGQEPQTFFYISPEQYEHHFSVENGIHTVSLDPVMKHNWHQREREARARYE